MPEGPEVKTMTVAADDLIGGHTLLDVGGEAGEAMRDKIELPNKILQISCHGKFSWIELEKGNIGIGFGMTGSWKLTKAAHCRFELHCQNEEGKRKSLYFCDPRNFGSVTYMSSSQLETKIEGLGLDIMKKHTKADIAGISVGKRKNVCSVMMDQSVLAGIGNYIKSEVLYDLRISPMATFGSLGEEALWKIYKSAHRIALLSYQLNGASLKTYRDLEGGKGGGKEILKVYARKSDPEGRKVHTMKTPDGRTTYYVRWEDEE